MMGVWSRNPRAKIKDPIRGCPTLKVYPAFAHHLKFVEALEYEAAFRNQSSFGTWAPNRNMNTQIWFISGYIFHVELH